MPRPNEYPNATLPLNDDDVVLVYQEGAMKQVAKEQLVRNPLADDIDLSEDVTGILPLANGGLGSTNDPYARSSHTGTQLLATISDAGTLASQNANNVNITGGSITGVTVGTDSDSVTNESTVGGATVTEALDNLKGDIDALPASLIEDTITNGTTNKAPTSNAVYDALALKFNSSDALFFKTIAVSGQSDVVADSSSDTLTIAAGANMTITTNATNDTITFASSGGGGGGLGDGDYGDITVSGSSTVLTIDDNVVTYSKMQNVSATDKLLGRVTAGAGDVEEITFTDFAQSLLDDTDASAARTTMGLVIGTNVQAYDAELAAIAGLTSAADKGIQFTGSGTAATYDLTTAGKALLDDADAATQRTTLGVGTGDSPQFTAINLGHASDTTLTRVSAGVIAVEGSNVLLASGLGSVTQAYDATLAAVAAYNTNGLFTQTGADTFTGRTITGTSNEISVSNGDGVSGNPTLSLPATIDLGGKTSLEIPNSAAPTVNADGEIAVDTTVADFSHGLIKYYSGEELGVVAMPIAEFGTPSDGHVVAYNATNDEFELVAAASGSGDVVGPASAVDNAIVTFDGTTGKLIQGSTVTADQTGNLVNVVGINFTGASSSITGSQTPLSTWELDGWDEDNTVYKPFVTITAGNTGVAPTCDLADSVTKNGQYIYRAGGTDVPLADGGTGASLTDPNADRIMFWDDSAGAVTWLAPSTGLTITNTDIALSSNAQVKTIGFVIDGGGSAITTGVKGEIEVPFGMTITGWTLIADQSGSIVIDVWKDTYANYPPTIADTITGSEKPTLSTATKNQDLSLSSWTTSVSAGDILRFNVDSASTVTRATLVIRGTLT